MPPSAALDPIWEASAASGDGQSAAESTGGGAWAAANFPCDLSGFEMGNLPMAIYLDKYQGQCC